MEDRLQKFAKLVDAGSFTKAAEVLHISQPALSTAINKLERELHTTLLLRGTRPLKLTPSGEAAYAHAKETAVRTGNLRLYISQTTQEKLAVKVGMIDSLADALLERGQGLSKLEQRASVSLVVDNSRNLAGAVARGDIDVAFVVEQNKYGDNIRAEHVGSEPLVLVCHRALLADSQRAFVQGELPNFISYDQNSNTFRLIQWALADRNVTVQPTFYSTSPEVIRKLVLAQKGVAVLPYLMVREFLGQDLLVPAATGDSPIIRRPILAIQHRDKLLPKPLVHLVGQLRKLLETLTNETTLHA